MKVVQLSTGEMEGGACRAAHRLHQGLLRNGVNSTMFVRGRTSDDPTVVEYQPPVPIAKDLVRRFRRFKQEQQMRRYAATRPQNLDMFSSSSSQFGVDYLGQIPPCDVLNVHWVNLFIDSRAYALPPLANLPLVFTLHDMNAFSGGCHYPVGCERFTEKCGACPQLGSTVENDLSRSGWQRKMDAFKNRPAPTMAIVAPSHWMAAEARRSSIFGRFPVSTIHNGLDTQVFSPSDRTAARALLGLPQDRKIILFAADSMANPRKGFKFLSQALEGMSPAGRLVVLFGKGKPQLPGGWTHTHLGSIANDRFLSLVYSAADLFVLPSLEENLGQTAVEAMACGIPVVGFNIGGNPDLVENGENGWLVPSGNAAELRAAIERLLEHDKERLQMGQISRQRVEKKFAMATQAAVYHDLYRSLLEKSAK